LEKGNLPKQKKKIGGKKINLTKKFFNLAITIFPKIIKLTGLKNGGRVSPTNSIIFTKLDGVQNSSSFVLYILEN
jgi:hypothetical protein